MNLLLFAVGTVMFSHGVKAQGTPEIRFSKQVRAQTKRMLVKNRSNNRQLIVSFTEQLKLSPQVVAFLTFDGIDALDLIFGLVYAGADRKNDPGFSAIDTQVWMKTNSRTLDREPYLVEWLETREEVNGAGRVIVLEQKSVLRELEDGRAQDFARAAVARTKAEREQLAQLEARRKKLSLEANGLLEQGWQQLSQRAYDKSLGLFTKAIDLRVLGGEAASRAFFGRGLSHFHQNGCGPMNEDFKEAEGRPEYRDDIRYYRALCEVDQGKFADAKVKLTEIVSSNHPQYSDAARFYLGVVAENEARFDEAESAYADTIDFSKDERLVGLARNQLSVLKRKQAQHRYNTKLFAAFVSAGVGYDSNVIALPTSLTPADAALDTTGSGAYQALVYLEAKNPLLFPLKQRFTYSFLNVGYFDELLAAGNNLISHDFGASVEWATASQDTHQIALGYNLTYLGEFGDALKYLGLTTLKWDMSRVREPQGETPRIYQFGARVSHHDPFQPASSDEDRQVAMAVAVSGKIRYRQERTLFGPGADLEYKKANGRENTYFLAGTSGTYDRGVGPEDWRLNVVGDLGLSVSSYHESVAKRFDTTLRYGVSGVKLWSSYLESRLQLLGTTNFSNVSSLYRYDRFQLNFVTTAFF